MVKWLRQLWMTMWCQHLVVCKGVEVGVVGSLPSQVWLAVYLWPVTRHNQLSEVRGAGKMVTIIQSKLVTWIIKKYLFSIDFGCNWYSVTAVDKPLQRFIYSKELKLYDLSNMKCDCIKLLYSEYMILLGFLLRCSM